MSCQYLRWRFCEQGVGAGQVLVNERQAGWDALIYSVSICSA